MTMGKFVENKTFVDAVTLMSTVLTLIIAWMTYNISKRQLRLGQKFDEVVDNLTIRNDAEASVSLRFQRDWKPGDRVKTSLNQGKLGILELLIKNDGENLAREVVVDLITASSLFKSIDSNVSVTKVSGKPSDTWRLFVPGVLYFTQEFKIELECELQDVTASPSKIDVITKLFWTDIQPRQSDPVEIAVSLKKDS